MKQVLKIVAIFGLGLLVTACDKCGNLNLNTPQFCGDAPAQK
jgi:hypothetical protein